MPPLSRLQNVAVDLGWPGALRITPQWLVSRRYFGLVADLDALTLEDPQRREIRVTALDATDVSSVCAFDRGWTDAEVLRRLDEGQQCTLGWWHGELAHVRWDSTAPVYLPYLDRVLRPGPGDQVVVEIHTAAAFRGRGVAGAVMVDASRRARALGISRLVWVAPWWNTRSLALGQQFASRIVGVVGYWILGPWRRYFASGAVHFEPNHSFRIDTAAPALRRLDA